MKKREIRLEVEEYEDIEDLGAPFNEIVLNARKACANAYSPYSHFMVGAAVLLENGEMVTGSNQENSAYPSGMCAERVALFYANAHYPDQPVVVVAVSAQKADGMVENPLCPCGACAQVLLETEERFGKPVRIILDGRNKIEMIHSAHDLLPFSFGKNDLLDSGSH